MSQGGKLITCDVDATTGKIAREYWNKSHHGKKIFLEIGPALNTPPHRVKAPERDGTGSSHAFLEASRIPASPRTLTAFLRRVLGSAVARPRAPYSR